MPAAPGSTASHKEIDMKSPWLAATLNFFFFGAGTLYVGKRAALPWALVTLGGTAIQILGHAH